MSAADDAPVLQTIASGMWIVGSVALFAGLVPGSGKWFFVGWAWRVIERLIVTGPTAAGAAVGKEIAAPMAEVSVEMATVRLSLDSLGRQLGDLFVRSLLRNRLRVRARFRMQGVGSTGPRDRTRGVLHRRRGDADRTNRIRHGLTECPCIVCLSCRTFLHRRRDEFDACGGGSGPWSHGGTHDYAYENSGLSGEGGMAVFTSEGVFAAAAQGRVQILVQSSIEEAERRARLGPLGVAKATIADQARRIAELEREVASLKKSD